ncbi:MAG: 2-oxoglutarate synthase subunit KorB [Methanosaeta sp. PtaB.Bin039]|nr:MAG: 2-oxoglutarate synthase subunit KorB [Methanosaeta sp. PtaB.Bin039]OPY47363.1 MAG: 2-oxoglutarate synthase subunit KorB [Methanosaeta sp. PtaU1.Bin028]
MRSLSAPAKNTWCPGCGNFAILSAIKPALNALEEEGLDLDRVVVVSGIGCHAKIADYLNVNSFYSIHGRVLPVATGIKLANPDLTVIGFAGDGDCYAEGLDHLIFAAKRNVDITLIVHNNRVYGLTTGQYTPTSPYGFKGRSTPGGTVERPLNPLEIVLSSGGSFLGRGYSHGIELLKTLFRQAILHKGFAFLDVLQVCATFYNMYNYYNQRVYELKDHDASSYSAALKKIREWDYNSEAQIALGLFYQRVLPTYEQSFSHLSPLVSPEREEAIRSTLESYI